MLPRFDGDMSMQASDLESSWPQCERGRVRCSYDREGTEICVADSWRHLSTCDRQKNELCVDDQCKSPCDLVGRGNVGCSFYPVNLWSTSAIGQLGIVVANTSDSLPAEVVVEDTSGRRWSTTVEPRQASAMGSVGVFRIDHGVNKLNQTEQALKGFHLVSNVPVAVYQFHPIDAGTVFSGSATLLLPEHVMTKSYFVMSYTYNASLITSPPQGQGLLAVVGISDNTQIEITVPVATKGGIGIPALGPGESMKRTLNRLEVLEIIQANTMEDISGAIVKASSPVVVYGGAGGVSIPATVIGGDHLGVQMPPLETWGKRYLVAKFKQRNASDKDYFRVVASVDHTNVTLSGRGELPPPIPELNRGQVYEFSTASDFLLEADQPTLAFQYMSTWGALEGRFDSSSFPDGVSPACPFAGSPDDAKCLGDANITPLSPIEQYRSDYSFYVPATYQYQYLNVTGPLDLKLTLDGIKITEILHPITATYGRVIVRIRTPGNHRITGTQPFGIIGYAYAYATSYSFVSGSNFDFINLGH